MARAVPMALPPDLVSMVGGLAAAQVADDQQWLLALMRKQGLPVIGMLWKMLGREQDVLDAYQTAICHLAAKGKGAIGWNQAGYFYRSAMNAGLDILRDRRRWTLQKETVADLQTRREVDRADRQDCSQALDQRQMLERMREAIYQLPPHLRDIIILRDLGELPYAQVAKTLGIKGGTARLYRRQAILRLARILGQEEAS